MDIVTTNLYDSLKKYYNHLFNTGYSTSSDLEKLLVYTFIEEIFEYSLVPYIDEKDYTILNEALNCLYGTSCILPYPRVICSGYFLSDVLNPLQIDTRRTEEGDFRVDEDSNPRITEEKAF